MSGICSTRCTHTELFCRIANLEYFGKFTMVTPTSLKSKPKILSSVSNSKNTMVTIFNSRDAGVIDLKQ